jgi:hypothetical protein
MGSSPLRAAIGIAQNARWQPVSVGSLLARKNCSPSTTFTWFFLAPSTPPLMLQNKKLLYDPLFRASAETLLEIALDPKHLGAEIGFLSVLHTWGQNLRHHPHIHCVIPAGGLAPDHRRWIHPRYHFLLPRHVLRRVFRGKFVDVLKKSHPQFTLSGALQPLRQEQAFASFLRTLFRQDWVVYLKPPFGGPQHVLRYLAGYTHRVAISNHRLVAFDHDQVTFRYKSEIGGPAPDRDERPQSPPDIELK